MKVQQRSLSERDYAGIAAACDRLLRAPGMNPGRIAIPLLHVINEHPGYLRQYAPLLRQDGIAHRMTGCADLPRATVRMGRALARSIRSSLRRPADTSARTPASGEADVLIVSHAANRKQLEAADDFYFGDLQRSFLDRGVTAQLALVNHLPGHRACDVASLPRGRWLLAQSATPRSETAIWGRCLRISRDLKLAARLATNPLDAAVAALAARHALSWATAANLRLHESVQELCARLQPRIVITTHEGDACERMIWLAARTHGRQPLCVGYQHTRLLEHAHSIRRSVNARGIECDPDVILTLGELSHATLAASDGLSSVRLIQYGSHRAQATGPVAPPAERARSCLVLPDGDEGEATILFEFALACAVVDPLTLFILRPHPLVDLHALRARHAWLRNLPANVLFSQGRTLGQDCARARYCLYRGSSAAVYAVRLGLKPFYLERAGELSFDPLFALAEWREKVASPADFRARQEEADHSSGMTVARRAAKHCEGYVSRLRPEALDDLLEMAGRCESRIPRSASRESRG